MDETAGIYSRQFDRLDTHVQIGMAQRRVLSVTFPATPETEHTDHELLDRIGAYLRGETEEFADVRVAMTMPTGKREVLEAAREIPWGDSATVEQLTRMVPGRNADSSDDHTEVREALAENPAPIFIPTHRVRDGPDGMPASVADTLRSLEERS